jgi:predicted histone-like DNA-binding protein
MSIKFKVTQIAEPGVAGGGQRLYYATVEVMVDALANGKIVRIGELGSLRISISGKGKKKAEEVNAKSISGARVIFTPGKEIKEMLLALDFEKLS